MERGHAQDLEDVINFLHGGYISADELRNRLAQIEPGLIRYPALDPQQFKKKVEDFSKAHAHDKKGS